MVSNLVVGNVALALVAVSLVFEEAAMIPSIMDVSALRLQAGSQISQGE